MQKTENTIQRRKVFIVDDHAIIREGLTELINREKDLLVCGDAEDVSTALQAIADSKPDIAIVDLTLKDVSGIGLIGNLLHYDKKLPILVLSMHDESVYAEKCLKAGAKGYIMKEEPSEKMISALRLILDGEVYVSDGLKKIILGEFVDGKSDDIKSPVKLLSNKEFEVFQLIGKGFSASEIAEQLHLSAGTIENYIKKIKNKMNLKSSREIIIHAVRYFGKSI
jgi:DNA-binding NarL/FixJ family response regulator